MVVVEVAAEVVVVVSLNLLVSGHLRPATPAVTEIVSLCRWTTSGLVSSHKINAKRIENKTKKKTVQQKSKKEI